MIITNPQVRNIKKEAHNNNKVNKLIKSNKMITNHLISIYSKSKDHLKNLNPLCNNKGRINRDQKINSKNNMKIIPDNNKRNINNNKKKKKKGKKNNKKRSKSNNKNTAKDHNLQCLNKDNKCNRSNKINKNNHKNNNNNKGLSQQYKLIKV